MSEKQKPFLSHLRELKVGESIEEPVSRYSYISMSASRFGLEWDKRFRISSNRDKRTVVVTRIA